MTMNEQQFLERVHANPQDASAEFLAALQGRPDRERLRDDLLALDRQLRQELGAVALPEGLRQKLLDTQGLQTTERTRYTAANAGTFFLHRLLPVAASLLAALGIAWYGQSNRGANSALEAEIFAHIYREAAYFEQNQALPLGQVNRLMDTAVGAELAVTRSVQELAITFADRCTLASRDSFHLIVQGENGPVTLLMVPDATPVDAEFAISDARFHGMVAPVNGGNLAVVVEGTEELGEYRDLISQNIRWKN